MLNRTVSTLFLGIALLASNQGFSKIHWNKPVAERYEHYHHISECAGTTLLTCMNTTLYDTIKEASGQRGNQGYSGHLKAIKNGIGVEFQLTDNVTTYHVKYQRYVSSDEVDDRKERREKIRRAQKSGRSFAGVGPDLDDGKAKYLADISYMDYFEELERQMYDREALGKFYEAILLVLVDSDASKIAKLSEEGQRLAGDFIAVYIAEQYRRMIKTDGDGLGSSQIWDDAHLQVTLLAAFHSGQGKGNFKMYFRGQFTSRTAKRVRGYYESDTPLNKKAEMQDYTQLGYTKGSGVNVTRRDFRKLGREITKAYGSRSQTFVDLEDTLEGWEVRNNVIESITLRIVNNAAPESFDDPQGMVDGMVAFLMDLQGRADDISDSLK